MSGNESQNAAVVRRGYEAFAKGDIETLKTLFAPNAHWRHAETGVLRGDYPGAQAILAYFAQLAQETQGSLKVEPQTMAASGDRVFVLERVTGKRNGKALDSSGVLVFKLDDGVVTEATLFQSDHPADARFWA